MLAKIPGVKKYKNIRARLLRGVDQWKDGIISDLVKDTYGTGKSHNDRARTISERDHKERTSMAYDQNVKADHIWSAVRHQTGGHLQSPGRETLQTQPIPERAGGDRQVYSAQILDATTHASNPSLDRKRPWPLQYGQGRHGTTPCRDGTGIQEIHPCQKWRGMSGPGQYTHQLEEGRERLEPRPGIRPTPPLQSQQRQG